MDVSTFELFGQTLNLKDLAARNQIGSLSNELNEIDTKFETEIAKINSFDEKIKENFIFVSLMNGEDTYSKFEAAIEQCPENGIIIIDGEYTIDFRAKYSLEISKPLTMFGGVVNIVNLDDANGAFYVVHHTKNVTFDSVRFNGDKNYIVNTKGINNTIANCVFAITESCTAIRFCNQGNLIIGCTVNSTSANAAIEHNVLDGDDGTNWTINNKIADCYINHAGSGGGLLVAKTTQAHLPEGLTVENTQFFGNAAANSNVVIDALYYGAFVNCIFDQCKTQNVALRANNDIVKGVSFGNCYFGSNIRTIIGVYAIAANAVTSISFNACYANVKMFQCEANCQNVSISGCSVECDDVAVWVSKGKNIIATANNFLTNGSYYFYYDAGESGKVVSKNNIKKGGATGSYTPNTNGFFEDYDA